MTKILATFEVILLNLDYFVFQTCYLLKEVSQHPSKSLGKILECDFHAQIWELTYSCSLGIISEV